MKKVFIALALLLSVQTVSVYADLASDALSIAKGTGAGIAAGTTTFAAWNLLKHGSHDLHDAFHGEQTLKHRAGSFGSGVLQIGTSAGLAYAVSKLAPYSKKKLTLESAALLDNPSTYAVTPVRGKAFIKGLIAGIAGVGAVWVDIVTAKKLFNEFTNHGLKGTSAEQLINHIGVGSGAAYTAYKTLPYAYAHLKNALAL